MTSSYLGYLPPILQQGDLIGSFLLAFEAVLSGLDPSQIPASAHPAQTDLAPGLEQLLAGVHRYIDPGDSLYDDPALAKDFLPWLAQWAATSLRDDWDLATKRKFLSAVVPLYRKRGTRAGMEAVLTIAGDDVRVLDFHDGLDEALEGTEFGTADKPPHLFGVILTVNANDPTLLARSKRRVLAILDQEKPAHTYFALRTKYPAMRINDDPAHQTAFGAGIFIGKNSGIGSMKA
jgi:phage tail-like protein